MFCTKCGAKIHENENFCPECGVAISNTNKVEQSHSQSSFGWGVLGFFIPIVGLILFLVWYKDRKKDAKAAGIGALISVAICIVMYILLFIVIFSAGVYY